MPFSARTVSACAAAVSAACSPTVMIEFRGLGLKRDTAEERQTRVNHHNSIWGPFGRNLHEDLLGVTGLGDRDQVAGLLLLLPAVQGALADLLQQRLASREVPVQRRATHAEGGGEVGHRERGVGVEGDASGVEHLVPGSHRSSSAPSSRGVCVSCET